MQKGSLMMAFCPEGIDMSRLSREKWYTEHSAKASAEYGEAAKKDVLRKMRRILKAT